MLRYYHVECPSWTWFYRYDSSPTLDDISSKLKLIAEKGTEEFSFEKGEALTSLENLLYVLPNFGLHYLPAVIQEAITKNEKLMKFYPTEYDFLPTDNIRNYTWKLNID